MNTNQTLECAAIQVEVQGMIALNQERTMEGMSLGYDEGNFYTKAEEIRQLMNLEYCPCQK